MTDEPIKLLPPPGRPSGYDASFPRLVRSLAKLGLANTDQQIAKFFEVAASTIYRWKALYPDFREAIKQGKILADCAVIENLYDRALTFREEHTSETASYDEFKQIMAIVVGGVAGAFEERKFLPPDVTAQMFWLRNRHPGQWLEKNDRVGDGDAPLSQEEQRQARLAAKIDRFLPKNGNGDTAH